MAKKRRNGEISALFGSGSSLEGVLRFEGQARIDGKFTGEIHGNGHLLVGNAAVVKADVFAESIVICGEVIGDVNATERIEIKSPGKLKGNISAPLVVMDEGVLFEGHCRMAGEENRLSGANVTLLAATEGG